MGNSGEEHNIISFDKTLKYENVSQQKRRCFL